MIAVLIRLCTAIWVSETAQQPGCAEELMQLRELDGTITALLHVPAPGTTLVLKSNYGDIPTRVITVRTEATSNEITGSAMPIIFVIPEDHL